MSHRVDAGVQPMQASPANPPVDLFFGPPPLHQLPSSHHPVLLPSKFREGSVVSASPCFSLLNRGFHGLAGHGAKGAEARRAFGAHIWKFLKRECAVTRNAPACSTTRDPREAGLLPRIYAQAQRQLADVPRRPRVPVAVLPRLLPTRSAWARLREGERGGDRGRQPPQFLGPLCRRRHSALAT